MANLFSGRPLDFVLQDASDQPLSIRPRELPRSGNAGLRLVLRYGHADLANRSPPSPMCSRRSKKGGHETAAEFCRTRWGRMTQVLSENPLSINSTVSRGLTERI